MQICGLLREALGELSFAQYLAAVVDSVARNDQTPAARHVDKYAAALERLDVEVLRMAAGGADAATMAAAAAAARAMRKVYECLKVFLRLFDVSNKYDFDGSNALDHSLSYAEVDCAAAARVIDDPRCLRSPQVPRYYLRYRLQGLRGDRRLTLKSEGALYAASLECHRLELAAALRSVRARLQN